MEENKTTQKGERAKSLKGSCLWGILLFAVLIFIDQLTKAYKGFKCILDQLTR